MKKHIRGTCLHKKHLANDELSELCGFNGNAQYLNQIFTSSFGCTPTEYKKMVALK